MPFTATTDDGGVIYPTEATQTGEYTCPECGEVLSLRRSHERAGTHVAAHFWHSDHNTACTGESDTHRRMKAIAASVADARWPESEVKIEHPIADRRADVAVAFDESDPRWGAGVAIECQHRNEQKDKGAVNTEMNDAGYTVVWVEQEHFTDASVDLDEGEWVGPFRTQLPDMSEWSGYHGVVRWLRQEKPTTAEIEVPLFTRLEHAPHLDGSGVFELYQQVVKLTEYNYCNCSVCGSEAVVYVRDPYDPISVRFPEGGFLCFEHADQTSGSPDDVSKKECGRCGELWCVGEMYPYRVRWGRIQRRREHPFDQEDVEWYCRECAAELPPLGDVRGDTPTADVPER